PGRRHRLWGRQRDLVRAVRMVARTRPPDHRHAPVPDDHRDPAGARELQADPGVAAATRTRDRVRRSAARRRRRQLCDDPRPPVTGQASAARALAMSSVAITSLPNVVYSNSMLTFAAAS